MFDRSVERDPRPAAPPSRDNYRMRNGHRREYAASRDGGSVSFPERCAGGLTDIGVHGTVSYRDLAETRFGGHPYTMRNGHRREYAASRDGGSVSFLERCASGLTDIGVHGTVSYRDLAEARFGGHPYTTRRAVNAWIRDGIVSETRATGPRGNPFKVLTLTRKGVAEVRKLGAERGMDTGQEIRFSRMRPGEAAHDTAVYRACRKEREQLEAHGATVRRIRLDTELKSSVARASEAVRRKNGKRAADAERHRIATERGLPVDAAGRVLYPDAQIEYADAEGRSGRVNIEAVSGNYRERSVRAKAAAGFRLHANGPAAAKLIRRLGPGSGDGSRLRGPADRDPAAVEL